MRTLTWFTEDNKMVTADVVEVEASDICTLTDNHIASVEANCGWWEVYRLPSGRLLFISRKMRRRFNMMLVEGNSKRITIEYRCPFCGQTKRAEYNTDEFTNWYMLGMTVYEAFQRENATKREILISNICPECQAKVFGPEESF